MRALFRRLSLHQRSFFAKFHTVGGVLAGCVILCLSMTGALLVYEAELDMALNPSLFSFSRMPNVPRIGFQRVIDTLKQHGEWKYVDSVYQDERRKGVYRTYHRRTGIQILIHPYTAKILAKRVYKQTAMGFIRHLHRTLLVPKVGKYIVGLSALICFLLVLTGLFQWFPKKRKHLPGRLSIKLRASKKRVNYEMHRTLGFYVSIFLGVLSLTGMAITFRQITLFLLFVLSFTVPPSLKRKTSSLGNKHVLAKRLTSTEQQSRCLQQKRMCMEQQHVRFSRLQESIKQA
ncbi:MAG: PepSY-associated TM helix domain-containing protein, partial [Myxococcota bacterium]